MEDRITVDLAAKVKHVDPNDIVRIVVELTPVHTERIPGASRKDQIINDKRARQVDFDVVKENIQRLGGEVLSYVWLNQTILVRVPAGRIPNIARMEKVNLVDLPHSMSLESTQI